ncbi:hypothetical protein BASA81_004396 [Batrachochytrium salamandrivorans]|nr:hypothetical protein BASA81_004396 [Batrachochytrium salamandrivorans]
MKPSLWAWSSLTFRQFSSHRPSSYETHTACIQRSSKSSSGARVVLSGSSKPKPKTEAVASVSARGVPASFVLYTYSDKRQYYTIYVSGFAHLIFWSIFSALIYSHQSSGSSGDFLSAKISDLVSSKSPTPNTDITDAEYDPITEVDNSHAASGVPGFFTESKTFTAIVSAVICGSIGVIFLAFSHRFASSHLAKLELIDGNTLRVHTCALIWNTAYEFPITSASLTRPLYTGVGLKGIDIPINNKKTWYKNMFDTGMTTHLKFDVAGRLSKRFLVSRRGSIPNPQFLDRLISEKTPLRVIQPLA